MAYQPPRRRRPLRRAERPQNQDFRRERYIGAPSLGTRVSVAVLRGIVFVVAQLLDVGETQPPRREAGPVPQPFLFNAVQYGFAIGLGMLAGVLLQAYGFPVLQWVLL